MAVISVVIQPGAIAFTWILCGANSTAIDLVNCTIAPLAALYEGIMLDPKYEYRLAIFIILPRPRFTIEVAASLASRKQALRLVSITRSQLSSVSKSTPPLG